jgi:hypothetical protein
MMTNQKTGMVLSYFVSAAEFEKYLKVRDLLPTAGYAWEMPQDIAAELHQPSPPLAGEERRSPRRHGVTSRRRPHRAGVISPIAAPRESMVIAMRPTPGMSNGSRITLPPSAATFFARASTSSTAILTMGRSFGHPENQS